MVLNMDDVLQKVGWTDGFHVPVSNLENRALEAEVERLMLARAKASAESDIITDRLATIERHSKHVSAEQEQNQIFLLACQGQKETEKHLLKIMEFDRDRMKQEIRNMVKQRKEIEERQANKKVDMAKGLARIEKLKANMEWDEDALKAWEDALNKKQLDNDMIKSFSKEDEKKANELEIKRQRLRQQVQERKDLIMKLISDVTCLEQVYDRTTVMFKQAIMERTNLIKQWKDSMLQLKTRDADILACGQDIERAMQLLQELQDQKDEQLQFQNNEKHNNVDLDREMAEANMEASKYRQELQEYLHSNATADAVIMGAKRKLALTAQMVDAEKKRTREILLDQEETRRKLEEMEVVVAKLREKLAAVRDGNLTVAEKATALEGMIKAEERIYAELSSDIAQMQAVGFKYQQQLFDLKEKFKAITADIASSETRYSLMMKSRQHAEDEVKRQHEAIYDLEYRVNESEERLMRLTEPPSGTEKMKINTRLTELEEAMAEVQQYHATLQSQVMCLEDDMRKLTDALHTDAEKHNILKEKLQNIQMLIENGKKHVNNAKNVSHQKQVEENVLRLRVSQAEKALNTEGDMIYSLQKQRLELNLAMKERQLEIGVQKDTLNTKKRNLEEEKGRLRGDIQNRNMKMEHLKRKFGIILSSMGRGDGGTVTSVTYFQIKNAQEKMLLEQEGDKLDIKIKKAEKEIIAMENTLKVVNATNNKYKASLAPVEEDGSEEKEMQDVQRRLGEVSGNLRKVKLELKERQQQIADMRKELKEREERREDMKAILETLEQERADLSMDIEKQKEKLERVDKRLRKKIVHQDLRRVEKEVMVRQYQDSNMRALQLLYELSNKHADVSPAIEKYLVDASIKPASRCSSIIFGESSSSSLSSTASSSRTKTQVSTFTLEWSQT